MATDQQIHSPAPMRRRLLPVAGLILLATLIVATAWWYRHVNRPTADREETAAALEEVSAEDSAAIAELNAAYDDAATDEGKAEAAYYLAARYSAVEDHGNALKYYREADKLQEGNDINVILGVANEAEAVGNKGLARDYYQKALDYYRPLAEGDSSIQVLVQQFESRLEELK